MNVVEFDTFIHDGKIDIPLKYQDDFSSRVRVVLLQDERKNEVGIHGYVDKGEGLIIDSSKQKFDPQEQLKVLEEFFKEWDAIDDEPLGEEFDKAVNAGLKFNEVDF